MGEPGMSDQEIREEAAYALGVEACLWGRPLVEYAVTFAAALKAGATRVSGLRYFDDLKTADDRFVVTPNNVTIDGYGTADLRTEPVVVSVPALAEDRWYIVQIGDYYDEIVHNIGGYSGPEPGLYVITGPDYQGHVPQAMTEVNVRTRFAVTALRVLVRGDADLPGARAVQRGFRVMPLSAFEQYGLSYIDPGGSQQDTLPPFEPEAPAELQPLEYLGFAMRQFLSASDGVSDTFIRQLRAIGLTVTGGFDWRNLDKGSKHGLARAIGVAEQITDNAYYGAATRVNGWRYTLATGRAGHNFALRAAFAKYLVGANVPEQLTYPNTAVDADGDPLTGDNRYVLRFEAGQAPPVSVFWNMSMYDAGELFIGNDFGRYSIGSTTDGLKAGPDGSITIVIQHQQPADTANWLPAPASGSFNLTMRMYGAQTPVLDGTYRLPPVTKSPVEPEQAPRQRARAPGGRRKASRHPD